MSTTLPRYVSCPTSSIVSMSSVTVPVLLEFTLRILLLPLDIQPYRRAECIATTFVFSCATVEPKHRQNPDRPVVTAMCIVFHFFLCDVDCFVIQSIAKRNKKGEIGQPCLTPSSHREGVCELTFVHYAACQSIVGVLNNACDFLQVFHSGTATSRDKRRFPSKLSNASS